MTAPSVLLRVAALALACAPLACLEAPKPPGQSGPQRPAMDTGPAATDAPQVSFPAPPEWTEEEPGMAIFLRSWSLPDGGRANFSWMPGRTDADAIAANVDRWIGQWEMVADEAGKRYQYDIVEEGAYRTHRIVGRGTLRDVRQIGGGEPREDWMLIGAVLETPRGPVYFKLIGPQSVWDERVDEIWNRLAQTRIE